MKYKFVKSLFALSAGIALLGTTACNKLEDFGTTDDRTDASGSPITPYLLTNAETGVANIMASTIGGIRGELYSQQWAETQYTDVSLYGNPQLDFAHYSTSLEDLQKIINLNTDATLKSGFNVVGTANDPYGSNGNQVGIATTIKVYYMWTLTDRWGDIPYTEALQGAGNLHPTFDKQEDIYPHLLADLKAAKASFDGGNTVKGDIFYGGDEASWKKVINSLRMLIALRMSKVYPNAGGLAATEFADAFNDADGSIDDNGDNWTMLYPGGTALQTNVFYSALNGRKDYAFSKTLGDICTNMADNRKDAYFKTPGDDFPYGLNRQDAVAFTGSVSGAYANPINAAKRTQTSPIVILPASYVLLAKAEAAQRGWIAGSAEDWYNQGVTASFAQFGATGAAAYLAGPANFTTSAGGGSNIGANAYNSIVGSDAITTTPLQRIQLQKYLASFADGVQAWSEWRRTGVPNLVPTFYGTNSPKVIPRRLTYGTTAYATNPDKVAEAAARYSGGDKMDSRMWWDQ